MAIDKDRLAVLVNLAGGNVYELANELNINGEILENILYNNDYDLTRNDELEINENLSRYERTQLDDYEKAQLQDFVNDIENVASVIDDSDNVDFFRAALADTRINLEDLSDAFLFFGQGDNTLNVQSKIIEWLADENNNASTFLELFANDDYRMDRYGEDSQFWAWYRETFYN